MDFHLLRSVNSVLDKDRLVFNANAQSMANTIDSMNEYRYVLGQISQLLNKNVQGYQDSAQILDHIAKYSQPRLVFVDHVRYEMQLINSTQLSLLLLQARQRIPSEQRWAFSEQQKMIMTAAMKELSDEIDAYPVKYACPVHSHESENRKWNFFLDHYELWKSDHDSLTSSINTLEQLHAEDKVETEEFSQRMQIAYEHSFAMQNGSLASCVAALDDLGTQITQTVTNSVREANENQEKTGEGVEESLSLVSNTLGETESVITLLDQSRGDIDQAISSAAMEQRSATIRLYVQIAMAILLILLGIGFGIIMANRISNPIRSLTERIGTLALGDLREDIPQSLQELHDEVGRLAQATQHLVNASRDEIRLLSALGKGDYSVELSLRSSDDQLGQAVSMMLHSTNRALGQVDESVSKVADGAMKISDVSHTLSSGAVESAASMEEIASAVSQINEQATSNAQSADNANKWAQESRDAARRGYEAMTKMTTSMGSIQMSGAQIASITKLIDTIAFQTNILALNAAVEAARAGRHGRGFSVVAEEVRNLAGRSAKAAKETAAVIEGMMAGLEEGMDLARQTDSELRGIVVNTEQVATLFGEITSASNAQSMAVNQVAIGLKQIDQVIQQNSQVAMQTAKEAELFSHEAQGLSQLISSFKLHPGVTRKIAKERILLGTAPERLLESMERQME